MTKEYNPDIFVINKILGILKEGYGIDYDSLFNK